jgi:hypothetical protein
MKLYNLFRDWCNSNHSVLMFLALIVAIIGIIPFNTINVKFGGSVLQKIGIIMAYKINIPVYILLILILMVGLYLLKYRSKYKTNIKFFDFLIGTWQNEWIIDKTKGNEICKITAEGKYYVNNEHCFNIENLKIDASTGSISFMKVSVRQNDDRRLDNQLNIVNNLRLEGTENGIKISYSKIS